MHFKSKLFVKFPNDFFYKDGQVLKEIGGRDSFIIYALFTSRKTMLNKVFITIRNIIEVANVGVNISRSKKKVINKLELLKQYGYIDYSKDLDGVGVNDTIEFDVVDKFSDSNSGWTEFYADDFELYYKIGEIAYMTMWILRLHANHKTNTSFISISNIADILQCSRTSIQNAINLFRTSGLFEVILGDYYKHSAFKQMIRLNNEYKYNGDVSKILNMSDEDIEVFLKRI